MTPETFRAMQALTGLSNARLGERLGVGESAVRNWSGGRTRVPGEVADWLRGLAGWLDANPPPQAPFEGRRRGPGRSKRG
jgi:hypothetical protein